MLILATEKNYDKKRLRKFHKVIISDVLRDCDDKCVQMSSLMPGYDLMSDYLNQEIGLNKFKKRYIKSIENNDEYYANLLTLMAAYKEHGDIVLVCSRDEYDYHYLVTLAQYIVENFGVNVMTYDKYKDEDIKEKRVMSKEGEEHLKKQLKKYMNILMDESPKKNKKKKDKDDKNKKKYKDEKKKKDKKHDKKKKPDFKKSKKDKQLEYVVNNVIDAMSDKKIPKKPELRELRIRRM